MPDKDILTRLPQARLRLMLDAGAVVQDCAAALARAGSNVVAEVIGTADFYEQLHYPRNDIYDEVSHAQFYYHAHRSGIDEHGHFHTFLRAAGMPKGVEPDSRKLARSDQRWPCGDAALSHIIAISMDAYGDPTRLFTVNRWVTAETWYPARDVIAMLGQFSVRPLHPYATVSRWISAMMVLFGPDIEDLVRDRDEKISARAKLLPQSDPLEDRGLEVISSRDISVARQIRRIRRVLDEGGARPVRR